MTEQGKQASFFDEDLVVIRSHAIAYLRTHRLAYIRSSWWFGTLAKYLSLGAIVLSSLTSIFAASQQFRDSAVLIVLPALAALCSTLLIQFRMRETWQLRDSGRIDIEELICDAHLMSVESSRAALEAAMSLRRAAHQIERRQSAEFFAGTKAALSK